MAESCARHKYFDQSILRRGKKMSAACIQNPLKSPTRQFPLGDARSLRLRVFPERLRPRPSGEAKAEGAGFLRRRRVQSSGGGASSSRGGCLFRSRAANPGVGGVLLPLAGSRRLQPRQLVRQPQVRKGARDPRGSPSARPPRLLLVGWKRHPLSGIGAVLAKVRVGFFSARSPQPNS